MGRYDTILCIGFTDLSMHLCVRSTSCLYSGVIESAYKQLPILDPTQTIYDTMTLIPYRK